MAFSQDNTITVQINNGQRIVYLNGVNKAWTVRQLKQHYCDEEQFNVRNFEFMFHAKQLPDHAILYDIGIRDRSTITMKSYLTGGGGDIEYDEKNEGTAVNKQQQPNNFERVFANILFSTINFLSGKNEKQAFLDESVRKKQYYNQYTSLSDYAQSKIDINNIDQNILVKDPHFVLTLNDLSDFGVNSNDNNYSEVNKLKQLKNCIKNRLQNPIIDAMQTKIASVYQVPKARVIITDVYYGTTNIGYVITDYEKDGVITLIKNAKEFESKCKKEFKSFSKMIITPPPESTDGSYVIIKSYHVSCASGKACGKWDCPEGKCRIAGVVLYMKDGKTKWTCGGRSCRTGYIIVKQSSKIPDSVQCSVGAIHGRVYKSVFNEDPVGIVGSGFSRSKGQWRWGSGSFNGGSTNNGKDKYHDGGNIMNENESKWIETAIKNWWNTGNQNTKVTESLVIFKD